MSDRCKAVKMNHHQGMTMRIRTDHMNKEEKDRLTKLY